VTGPPPEAALHGPAQAGPPLRILYLHQHFSRPEGSTATRSFLHAAALAAAGHAVTLACGRYAGAETGLRAPFHRGRRSGAMEGFVLRQFDIPYDNAMGLGARSRAFLRFAAAATRLALAEPWDLVVASSTPLTVAVPALVARRRRGVPFLFEIRDPWPELPRALSAAGGGVPRPVLTGMGWLASAACRQAAAVVTLTEGVAGIATARGADPRRVRVLPQGADLGLFGPGVAPWRPPGLDGAEVLAVYAGAHGAANGLDQLLDAAALLRGAGLRLVLVGEGARKPALMARAAAEALPVSFLDPLPKPRLAALLAAADIGLLCLAPVAEFAEWSAPNKLVEGLAAGLPMVANVPGRATRLLREGGCGLAVPPGDAAALAAALRRLAGDPALRATMGRAARALAEARFDARRIAAGLVETAEEAAAGAPVRAGRTRQCARGRTRWRGEAARGDASRACRADAVGRASRRRRADRREAGRRAGRRRAARGPPGAWPDRTDAAARGGAARPWRARARLARPAARRAGAGARGGGAAAGGDPRA
jgi:glycosyltransferase involved in cell wall biosynthesis